MGMEASIPLQWREGYSLEGWIDDHRHMLGSFHGMLITAIDGIESVAGLPSLSRFGIEADEQHPDRPLLVSPATLLTMLDAGYFTGFDEVWCLDSGVAVPDNPPINLHSAEYDAIPGPAALRDWMKRTGARVGVGDGWGLLVVSDDDAMLDRFSIRNESQQ